jgi:hypothetical protein
MVALDHHRVVALREHLSVPFSAHVDLQGNEHGNPRSTHYRGHVRDCLVVLVTLPLLAACRSEAPAVWAPGELYVEQLDLGGGTIGEAALIVGPDGTRVLVDVGNDAHADAVASAVLRATSTADVHWIVLTHYHADHIGGMDELAIGVTEGVITRGAYDLGEDANAEEWAEVVALREQMPFFDLCSGTGTAASGCPGLAGGTGAVPGVLALGEGAELRIVVADGFTAGAAFEGLGGSVADDENARSLGGTVRWGEFVYWWGGDLTGGGKGTPDLEGWLADVLPEAEMPEDGVDVAHLHHHGLSSSTNARWAERLFPTGATSRSAIVGATGAYIDAPSEEALAEVTPRIGEGFVWATENGWTATTDARLRVAHGPVIVRVQAGVAGHTVEAAGVREAFVR